MRGLADQGDSVCREFCRMLDRQRKHMATRLDTQPPKDGMRLPFGGCRKLSIAEHHPPRGLGMRHDPDDAGSIARQRHEHAGALRGVEFRRDVAMRPRMADVEGQRGLLKIAASYLDAGGLAA